MNAVFELVWNRVIKTQNSNYAGGGASEIPLVGKGSSRTQNSCT